MSTSTRSRVPRGARTGGQFATEARAESDVDLTPMPPDEPWSLTYWEGDIRFRTDDELHTVTFASRGLAETEADRLAAGGQHVQIENWSADHPQDDTNGGWALVGGRDPAPDPDVVELTPATTAELRRALNNRSGEPDGKRRVVVVSRFPRSHGSDQDLVVRGPRDGRVLTVILSGGFTPVNVESGNVVVLADSPSGNPVHVGFGAHVEVQAAPSRMVSTTTEPGGHTVVKVAPGCHGLQHVEAGGVLEVLGDTDVCDVRVSGAGRGRRATVCAVCRQTVSVGDDGQFVHAGGGDCLGPQGT